MKGFVTRAVSSDYEACFARGQKEVITCALSLRIGIDDIDTFIADPNEQAHAEGYVDFPILGGHCPVDRGVFNLLVDAAPERHDIKHMLYRLFMRTGTGRPLT